ncbi:MAG: proteasome subunit beta [Micrococcales bacterium]|nr:proteasome subunit beta [Micrococcales bacterium]
MSAGPAGAGLTGPYMAPGTSFIQFLADEASDLMPGHRWVNQPSSHNHHGEPASPVATTIVALTYRDGLIMAGDRRATMGHTIASREMEKVYPADAFTAIGISGTAGPALDLVRLYQLELTHYEKVEGACLSLDGKANRLGAMLRGRFGLALQGLAVVPLLGGLEQDQSRIYSFDLTGGHYQERDYAAAGSGALYAKSSLKKLHKPRATARAGIRTAIKALMDAADDDAGTAGPDFDRAIWPVVAQVSAKGYHRLTDQELAPVIAALREDTP